jgi:methylisocitrate lyase
MTKMPLILDIDDGFGRPISTYYACKRLSKAGAAGVLVTDSRENSRPGGLGDINLVKTRIKAAHDGFMDAGDDDALIIARCDVNPRTNFEEYIERSNTYLEAGANMICLCPYSVHGEGREDLAKRLGENIKGWLWWPDLSVDKDGNAEFDLKDLFSWGYKMTGVHYSMHASMIAMLDAGRHVFKERSNAYIAHAYDFTGYKFGSAMSLFGLYDNKWIDLEAKYVESPDQAILRDYSKFFCRPDDCYDPDAKD